MNLDPDGNPNFSPEASFCPESQTQGTVLFADDFETIPPWSTVTLAGTENLWYWSSGYATSGERHLYNVDISVMSDAVIWNANPVALSSGAFLQCKFTFGTPNRSFSDPRLTPFSFLGSCSQAA